MKSSVAIIFYVVFTIVYTSLNLLILVRANQAAHSIKWLRVILVTATVIGYISFLASIALEKTEWQKAMTFFRWISSSWLASMLYLILPILIIDILRLLNWGFGIFPEFITANYEQTKLIVLAIIVTFSTSMILVGKNNASKTKVNEISINIPSKNSKLDKLKILFASDIHLGTTITEKDMKRFVEISNEIKPDLILFGGDILDGDVRPAISNNSGEPLKKLKAPLGIYGITGNHEYIGGDIEKATKYIEGIGIKMIRDNVLEINSSIQIAGREDKEITTFTGEKRQPLEDVIEKADKNLPLILMDHQPYNLHESEKLGVDLHLSGHTHNGQLWPLNYITDAIFEKSWGYLKKGNTHFYISCGFGIWGPRVRIGSQSEIVVININFIE